MKKLALVLGSLLVVGTAVSAKEVMPAPVAAPERVVEVVEKPVIVYRDREVAPAWRPNGSVGVEYQWYGKVENRTEADNKSDDSTNWGTGKEGHINAGRLVTTAKVNFTEKQTLDLRVRNSHALKDDEEIAKSSKESDDYRLRHFYNFGTLGTSKVTAKSRLGYEQKAEDGAKKVEASVFFDFSDYVFSNQFFKADKLGLRPSYGHAWARHGKADTKDIYGLAFESEFSLPYNFSFEFNVKPTYTRSRVAKAVGKDGELKKGAYNVAMDAILKNHTPLYKTNSFELAFDFEGGYDSYNFAQYKAKGTNDKRSYSLYVKPTLGVNYKPTDFVNLYANAGATLVNGQEKESQAGRFRWQPVATAGMKVTF